MDISKLTSLHDAVAEVLLDKVLSPEATASDIANAIKFLKDNGINCDGTRSPVIIDLTESLPAIEELEGMYR